jgi:hypothetical protein
VYALLVAAIVACRPAVSERRDTSAETMSEPNAVSAADSLELRLLLSPQARVSDSMTATLRVKNIAVRPLDLYLRGRTVTVDVVAERGDGGQVWRRLDGAVVPAIVHHRRLGPDEALDVPISWSWSLTAGEYRLHALLLTEGEPLASDRVSVVLRP